MKTKDEATKTARTKKPAVKRAPASRSTAADAPVQDDGEWTRIERLYDTPQEQWTLEEWRMLAVYLQAQHERVVAELGKVVTAHERTLDLLANVIATSKKTAAHTQALTLIDREIRAGRMVITTRATPKKPGRHKKLSAKQEEARSAALVALAARHTPTQAAAMMARFQLKREGLDPDSKRAHIVAKLRRYAKSWANKVAPARRWAVQQITEQHGDSPAAIDMVKRLKLVEGRARKSPKNS